MLIGNLTRDPEIRYTSKGTPLAEIGLAINRVYSGEDGQKKEEVTFVDVTLWSRLAEIAEQYLKKGQPVFIEGRLQLDTWDDKQTGKKRSRLHVIGENLQMLGSREARSPTESREGAAFRRQAASEQKSVPNGKEESDDVPF